ncbi:MAG: LamG domain-containing protein, partial [Patescibacteria group bacterium]
VKYNEAGYKLLMESDGDITCGIDYDSTWTPTDSVTSTAATYDDNFWHYVACVKNANTSLTLYIDGLSVGTPDTSLTNSTLANTDPLYIGIDADGTSNDWVGKVDQFRIYNYSLTQAQVSWDYSRGAPVAWYKFDECQGTTAYNSALNGNGAAAGMNSTINARTLGNTAVGTCNSGVSTEMWNDGTTGKYTSSLGFDSSDDDVSVTNASAIDLNEGLQNGLTISAWIYANSDGEADVGKIFTKGTETLCQTDSQSGSNLDIQCELDLATDATLNIASAITTGTWNHIVMSWADDSDDEISIWINGIPKGTSADGVGPTSADTNNIIIGNDSTQANTFDGLIDDFKIFNYELTSAQIRTLYNEGSAVRFGPQTGSP